MDSGRRKRRRSILPGKKVEECVLPGKSARSIAWAMLRASIVAAAATDEAADAAAAELNWQLKRDRSKERERMNEAGRQTDKKSKK